MMKKPKKFRDWKLNQKFTFVIILSIFVSIGIFAFVLFYQMEENVIKENHDYVSYNMIRTQEAMAMKINSINMSTQFFLSDEELLDILKRTHDGEDITIAKWLEFKKFKVASLERLVSNNPLLYSVRVYAENDRVQEMMPILYNRQRMQKQEWAGREDTGWFLDYRDNTFSSYNLSQNGNIMALLTVVTDRERGRLGVIEAAMSMKEMFPGLYEKIEGEWSCFIDKNGNLHTGDSAETETALIPDILSQYEKEESKESVITMYLKAKNRSLIAAFLEVSEPGGTLVSVKDITESMHHVSVMRRIFLASMTVILAILIFFTNRIVQRLLRQFYRILNAVRAVQKGDLNVRIETENEDEMGELSQQLNKMLDRIQKLMQENLDRELLAKNSQIRALQNQINAHFIYNVLETVKMMAEIDEEYAISDAVTSLGKLLRYSMKWTGRNVTVGEELEYIRNYVALINLRFDYSILLSLNLSPEIPEQEIPKMCLQPIVENAILHGIEEMAEDSTIYMKGYIRESQCIIEITDNGKGMSAEEIKKLKERISGKIEPSQEGSGGIGLKNVQDRITIAFGTAYGLDIASMKGCYTKVIVRLPVSRKESTK